MHSELYNCIDTLVAVAPASIASDTTTAGIIIDTQGYDACDLSLFTGAVTAGDVTLSANESDDSGMSGATAVSGDFLVGGLGTVSAANTVDQCGLILTKRYLQVSIISDNSANLVAGALVVLKKNIAGK